MKPKLIIGAGVGWSATRSLMFSLSNYNHGLGKEDHILYQLSINDPKHLKFYTESKETRERNKNFENCKLVFCEMINEFEKNKNNLLG